MRPCTCHRGLFGSKNRNYQKLQASTCFNGPKSRWVEGIWLKAKVEPKWNHISWQMEESLSTFPGWLECPSQWLLSRFNLIQSNKVLYNSIPSLSLCRVFLQQLFFMPWASGKGQVADVKTKCDLHPLDGKSKVTAFVTLCHTFQFAVPLQLDAT
jgi:hypothetical protein